MNIAFNIAANLDYNISGSGIDPNEYEMERTYQINGTNAYTQYGLVFKKGTYNQLLEMPTAWPEEVRKINLPIAIIATNESSFWQKYYAFRALMTSGAEFILQVDGLYRRFKLSYRVMSDFNMLTYITQENKVASSFMLGLDDDYPDAFTYTRTASFQKMNASPGYVGSMVEFSRIYTSFSLADAKAFGDADTSFAADGLAYANQHGTDVPLFDVFKPAVLADGGTFDDVLFNAEYAALPTLAKTDSATFLIPGSYKNGTIYGADNKTGKIVPFTFSRAGTATYFDKNGVLQIAAAGMPRIDYDPLTKAVKGYLLENASTNFYNNSETFTGPGTGLVVTTDTSILDPRGTTSTVKLSQGSSGYQGRWHTGVGSLTSGQTYTYSIFVKKAELDVIYIVPLMDATGAPSHNFRFTFSTEIFTPLTYAPNAVMGTGACRFTRYPDGWYRLEVTETITSTDTYPDLTKMQFRALLNSNGAVSTTGHGVYVFGEQLEQSSVATSYIPTGASQVIRVADSLVSVNDITPYPEVSLFTNLMLPSLSGVWTGIMRGVDSTKGRLFTPQTQGGFPQSRMYDGTTVLSAGNNSFGLGSSQKISTSYGAQGMKIAANGSYLTKSAFDGLMGTEGGALRVISQDSNPGFSQMYLKSLVIFKRQLTDAEHTSITA